jgi:acetyl esterase/lipase
LIVYVHGGGFVSGDKAIDNTGDVERTVSAGVAFASLNYRLLADVDKEGVIKPMTDVKRALQFIRYHASKLNIDASRVGLKGDSGGAGTVLWIGLHDDMAGSRDPVDAMSTRVKALAPSNTQATYDLAKWETVVFAEYGVELLDAVALLGKQQRFLSFYGMSSMDQFETPTIQAYRAEVDMLAHMSADDPPVFVHNAMPTTAAPTNQSELFHHAAHARAIKAIGTKAGVAVTAVIPAFDVDESGGKDDWSFLLARLKNK